MKSRTQQHWAQYHRLYNRHAKLRLQLSRGSLISPAVNARSHPEITEQRVKSLEKGSSKTPLAADARAEDAGTRVRRK